MRRCEGEAIGSDWEGTDRSLKGESQWKISSEKDGQATKCFSNFKQQQQ